MAAKTFTYEQPNGTNLMGEDESEKSSLQKTFGNVMNLLNDGLYRMKNRTKSE